ncbi:MAG: UDP-2,3-diacylglucosamine diphosphatase [Pseudomonadota bacterium]
MKTYRTLFISDVHLGTRNCQADLLLDFLNEHNAETIYLVGDIVDFWRIRRGAVWAQSHNEVLQNLLGKVRAGTKIIFIPGNHDDGLRQYVGQKFGTIDIELNCVFTSATGKRYLVMHGDEFDVVVRYAKWLALLGDRGYQLALYANMPLNFVRRKLGLGYWSLSNYLKSRVKSAVNFIGEFEDKLSIEARRSNADGIVCGHIHRAASRQINDVHYLNCGDWVESCTAIAETDEGELELINWLDVVRSRASDNGGLPGSGRRPGQNRLQAA